MEGKQKAPLVYYFITNNSTSVSWHFSHADEAEVLNVKPYKVLLFSCQTLTGLQRPCPGKDGKSFR